MSIVFVTRCTTFISRQVWRRDPISGGGGGGDDDDDCSRCFYSGRFEADNNKLVKMGVAVENKCSWGRENWSARSRFAQRLIIDFGANSTLTPNLSQVKVIAQVSFNELSKVAVAVALAGNSWNWPTFRPTFKDTRKWPSAHFMSVCF